MDNATQYAKAIFATKNPSATRVREALAKRGHLRLMPRILAEYEKLQVAEKRLAKHKTATPEQEQTRVLFELYKKLTS